MAPSPGGPINIKKRGLKILPPTDGGWRARRTAGSGQCGWWMAAVERGSSAGRGGGERERGELGERERDQGKERRGERVSHGFMQSDVDLSD